MCPSRNRERIEKRPRKRRLCYEDHTSVISFSHRNTECHRKFSLISHLHSSSRAAHRGLKRPQKPVKLSQTNQSPSSNSKEGQLWPWSKVSPPPRAYGDPCVQAAWGFLQLWRLPFLPWFHIVLAFVLQKPSFSEQVLWNQSENRSWTVGLWQSWG